LLVGKEHVGGKTTLRCVGVYEEVSTVAMYKLIGLRSVPFFFFSVRALVALFVVFSLGMVLVDL